MATGDQDDFLARLKSTLPPWFTDDTPILDAVLYGWAATWTFIYALLAYAKQQTRILTASDGWLDMISGDFFGNLLLRKTGQTDQSYRTAIQANIFRERATRDAVTRMSEDITGRTPIVIEQARILDYGIYSGPTSFYGATARYGSQLLTTKYQCFVKVYRPLPGTQWYGLTDADIYSAIDSVRPVDVTIWVQILN
jgi:hypothetical protein